MNAIVKAGIGIGAFYLVVKALQAGTASRLNFLITGFSIGLQGLTPTINVTIAVQNPTNTSLTLTSFTGNAYVNDQYVGNVSDFTQTELKANSQTNIVVVVMMNVATVVTDIIKILTGAAGVQASLHITGTVNVSAVLFPVDQVFKII